MFYCTPITDRQREALKLLQKSAVKAGEKGFHLPSKVEVDFSLNSIRMAGIASCMKDKTTHVATDFKIELHGKALETVPFSEFSNTIIHEFVHILQWINYPTCTPHGREFHYLMGVLGVEKSERCHAYNLEAITGKARRRQRRWEYTCNCGTHSIATVTHNRMQKGQVRVCKGCSGELTFTGKELK